MNHIERRDKELAYISDEAVLEEQIACRTRISLPIITVQS